MGRITERTASQPTIIPPQAAIRSRYGDKSEFLAYFNPDIQSGLCKDSEACLFGDFPTLAALNAAYGGDTAASWLLPQLYDLSEFCGSRDKLEGRPLEQCAGVIAAEFRWLKVSELMLFFHRFKSGKYGKFYGGVDPLVITTSLREFVRERNDEIAARECEERTRKALERSKEAVTWEEYCRTTGKDPTANPLDRVPLAKPERPEAEDPAAVLRIAKLLVEDLERYPRAEVDLMFGMFRKKYGKSPEEYVADQGESPAGDEVRP